MHLIVTHEQPDFDALASLALAKLLFPGAITSTHGSLSDQLRAFIRLYRDELDLTPLEQVDLEQVKELVVVDTADPSRIKPFQELLGRVPVTVYDHHPTPEEPIAAARGITEQVGATATLLTRELSTRAITIPPPVATLALLGIHEDTGSLTYDLSSPDDYLAAAHLLASGANLEVVRRFAHRHLSEEQLAFQAALMANTTTTLVAGRPVAVAAFHYPTYVPAVSGLVNELLDLFGADAAVAAVGMEGSTLVFARSNERFDTAAALAEAIGGAGHPGAAFGKSEAPPEETLRAVTEALARHGTPAITAVDLMSSPVKSAGQEESVADAAEKLLLYGHNGMPVCDEDGNILGVVSRRDIDRAMRHGLGGNRVTGFMSRDVITAAPTATLRELEGLVLKHNIGRIPITEGAHLVGIVTRTDLIGARHHKPASDKAARLLRRLPSNQRAALEHAARVAGASALYLVGGTVRDLLLGTGVNDIDLVVEGKAPLLGSKLQHELGGTLSAHVDFGTATLTLPSGLELDIASAREETYARPAALPDVVPSSIRKDMSRRDFSINAMALRLNPTPVQLLDPFSGEDDLKARLLRVLHPLSFVEDPTRVLRGARLAGRLGFAFEASTETRARSVLKPEFLEGLSNSRARAELELTLAEPRVAPALGLLTELGALKAIFGLDKDAAPLGLKRMDLIEALDARRRKGSVPNDSYLLALLLSAPTKDAEAHVEQFNWPRKYLLARAKLIDLLERDSRPDHKESLILDEELTELSAASRGALHAASPSLAARLERVLAQPAGRKLRGSDVVALGLPPGPDVGRVLRAVAQARAEGLVNDFEAELNLARQLITELPARQGSE